MKKTETTFKNFLQLHNTLPIILTNKKDRLTMSVVDFRDNLRYPLEKFNKKRTSILRETASLDEDGNFFLDKDGKEDYNKVNKEGSARREKELEALLNEKIEIEPAITSDLTRVKKLPLEIIKLYNGWLWNLTPEKIEEIFLEEETKEEIKEETKTQ